MKVDKVLIQNVYDNKVFLRLSKKLGKKQVQVKCESFEAYVLLENFLSEAVFRTQFTLLLFLRG